MGFDLSQFLILIGLIILLFLSAYIKHWIRYFLCVISVIGIIIILLSGFLPLYKQKLDWDYFYNSQKINFVLRSNDVANDVQNSNGKIIVQDVDNELNKKEIALAQGEKRFSFDLGSKLNVSFSSKLPLGNSDLFIILPNGIILIVHPQSAISFGDSGYNNAWVNILNGKMDYYLNENKNLTFVGDKVGNLLDLNSFQDIDLVNEIENKKLGFASNIAGGEIMLNKNVDAFVRVFLNFLYSIFPLKYGQNLVNYSE
ncbi:MAG: hypothetical protein WC872_03065, partial [Candidatus Absconditabacterales bacterium]